MQSWHTVKTIAQAHSTSYVWRSTLYSAFFFDDEFLYEKSRDKLSLRPHGGKSVAYRLQNAPFVFTRQRVDVTDVLSALSYDGLLDVRAVCHSVSGGCRATDLKWLSCQSNKRCEWRFFHRSRRVASHDVLSQNNFSSRHANVNHFIYKYVSSSCCSLSGDTLNAVPIPTAACGPR